MEYSSTDVLYILGMYETMCLQSTSNDNHRWYMEGNKLRFQFSKNLEEGESVRYHYA